MACRGTYTFIPPPPLPEFYQPRDTAASPSLGSVEDDTAVGAAEGTPICVDGAYDGRLTGASMFRAASTPLMAVPPHPPGAVAGEVPPLAIYHICRVCLRPRSPRYHREHPIPIDGLPPPPGICRRCRVTSVEDTKRVADVVKVGESNNIKIGFITPFVPDEAVISNEEMRARNVEKYSRNGSAERETSQPRRRPRKDIVYRHVKIAGDAGGAFPPPRTRVRFKSRDDIDSISEESVSETPPAPITTATSMQVQPTESPPSIQAKATKGSARQGNGNSKSSTSTRTTTSTSTTAKGSTVVNNLQSGCTRSEIRQIAREEVQRYRDAYWIDQRSESNIRRIAREEVERYRVAERKLEAHPDPYAHGRMVPVERRIEQERDLPDPPPWIKFTENRNEKVSSRSHLWTQLDYQPATTQEESVMKSSEKNTNPQPQSFLDPGQHLDRDRERIEKQSRNPAQTRPIHPTESDPLRQARRTSSSSNESMTRNDWQDEHHIKKAESSSSRRHETSVRDDSQQEPKKRPSQHPEDSYKRNSSETERTGSSKHAPCLGRKDERRPTQHAHLLKGEGPVHPEFDIDYTRIKWPVATPMESSSTSIPSRGRHSNRNTDVEYLYAERIVQPAGRPLRRRPFDDHLPARYVEIEEIIETRRDRQPSPKPPKQEFNKEQSLSANSSKRQASTKAPSCRDEEKHYYSYEESRERANASIEPDVNVAISGVAKRDDRIPSHRKRVVEVEGHVKRPCREESPNSQPQSYSSGKCGSPDHGDSNHVRFSGEVDVSPTPPNSDADSSEFLAYHSSGRKSLRQVDDNQSSHGGGFSFRESEWEEKVRDGGPSRSYDQHEERSPRVRKDPVRTRQDRTSSIGDSDRTNKPHRKVNTKDSAVRNRLDGGDGGGSKGEDRKPSGAERRPAPLRRALSESPSREGSLSSLGLDGRGPYRAHGKVTDSMRVEDGSPSLNTRRGDVQRNRQRQHD